MANLEQKVSVEIVVEIVEILPVVPERRLNLALVQCVGTGRKVSPHEAIFGRLW